VTYTETDLVATIERMAETDLAALTQAQRDQIDQFHGGGSEAVDRLLPNLHLAPGMTVLDVGLYPGHTPRRQWNPIPLANGLLAPEAAEAIQTREREPGLGRSKLPLEVLPAARFFCTRPCHSRCT
jgi:hypothetical protein